MSPRNAANDERRRQSRREQILDAAMVVIARSGLSGTKMATIAEVAGLSVGNLYKYFSGKNELFEALVVNGQQEYRQYAEEAANRDGTAYDKLLWYTREWFVYHNAWAHTLIMAHARTSESVSDSFKEGVSQRFQDNLKPIARIIAQGQLEGSFIEGDPTELALLYVSLMEGLIMHDIPGLGEISTLSPENIFRLLIKNG